MGWLTSRLRGAASTSLEVLSGFLFWGGLAGYAYLSFFMVFPETLDSVFPTNKTLPVLLLLASLLLSLLGGLMFVPAGIVGVWRMRDLEPLSVRLLGSALSIGLLSGLGVAMIFEPVQLLSRVGLSSVGDLFLPTP